MFKLLFVLLLAFLVWGAVGALDWILGIGVLGLATGIVGAVVGVVVGVIGGVFGIVIGVIGVVIGIMAVVLVPVLILWGLVRLFRTAF